MIELQELLNKLNKLSESIVDDERKAAQEERKQIIQTYEEIKNLDHQQLVDKLIEKYLELYDLSKNFLNKQTNNNLIYRILTKDFSDWQVKLFFKKNSIDINEEVSFSALGTAPTPGVKVNGNPVQGKSVKKKLKRMKR